ncbi:MAG: four helix bundle protein [Patescibacteria group bacterium]
MAFRFRNFKVYQDAKSLHIEIAFMLSKFSRNYYYLSDQIKRSSLSVLLNIAEGSSKQSDKDFNRYITIALGSVDETVASLEIAFELKIINEAQFNYFEEKYEIISRQLGGLSKKLKNS